MRYFIAVGACAIAAAISAPALADMPVVVTEDFTLVSVQFVSSNSDLQGHLYFLGSGDADTVFVPAPDSGPQPGLGTFLFDSTTADAVASAGDPTEIGIFMAGDVLHFAYDVLDAPTDLFRTDDPVDVLQYQYFPAIRFLHIDDVRAGSGGDGDYDDMIICFNFVSAVPAPGGLAVLGLLLGAGARRRRR